MVEQHENIPEIVKLISSDDHIFYIDKKCAIISPVIETALNGPGIENISNVVRLRTIPSHILEPCIQYFYYRIKWNDNPEERPEFRIDPKIAISLLNAASLLET